MKNRLTKIKCSKQLCAIYTDEESTNRFAVGYVISCDEYTIFELYDPYGHYDGIACFLTDFIYQVKTKTKYLLAIEKLVKHYNEKSCYNVDSVVDILNEIKQGKRICEIEFNNSGDNDISGVVNNFDDDIVEFTEIDEYGQQGGESTFKRSIISSLSFDSSDTRKLEILSKN